MALPFCKAIDLVFNTWTIPWPHPINTTTEHWASIEPGLENIVNLLISVGDPATSLFGRLLYLSKRKPCNFFITRLLFHFGIIQASTIYTRRSSSFQAITFKPQRNQLLGDSSCCFLSNSSTS